MFVYYALATRKKKNKMKNNYQHNDITSLPGKTKKIMPYPSRNLWKIYGKA